MGCTWSVNYLVLFFLNNGEIIILMLQSRETTVSVLVCLQEFESEQVEMEEKARLESGS